MRESAQRHPVDCAEGPIDKTSCRQVNVDQAQAGQPAPSGECRSAKWAACDHDSSRALSAYAAPAVAESGGEYERLRLLRIEKNRQKFIELGLGSFP